MSDDQVRAQHAQVEAQVNGLGDLAAAREDAFAAEASRLRLLDRARLAVRRGLAARARDLLLESDVSAFGAQGMALELELLLRTGRAKEVREWTTPEQMPLLGEAGYHWLRAQAFAASGDYAAADEELEHLAFAGQDRATEFVQAAVGAAVGQRVLDERPGSPGLPGLLWRSLGQLEFASQLGEINRAMRKRSDGAVLQGLVALESGEVERAATAFRAALALWGDEPTRLRGGGEFAGRVVAEDCLRWLERAGSAERGKGWPDERREPIPSERGGRDAPN
jgi:hypothetical protein